jgi:deoxyadenosine/deoxycytidine kinase
MEKMPTPIIISIDGNIGAGKTTFLNELKTTHPEWHFIDEPVDSWMKFKNEHGESLLEVFYKDRKRWSYTFQNCAFLTRIRAITKAIEDFLNSKETRLMTQIKDSDKYMKQDDRCLKIHKTKMKHWNAPVVSSSSKSNAKKNRSSSR